MLAPFPSSSNDRWRELCGRLEPFTRPWTNVRQRAAVKDGGFAVDIAGVHEILHPLRIPGFGRLVSTYWLNEVADWLTTIALSILVWDATHNPFATTALFLAIKFLPGFLVPPLTARLDGTPVARTLGRTYLLLALAVGALAITATTFLLPVVLFLALASGTLAALARATTRTANVAVLEAEDKLREGNALLNLGYSAMNVLGPVAAGAFVALFGTEAVLGAAALIFFGEAIVAGTAKSLPRGGAANGMWTARLREALAYVRGDVRLRTLLGGQALVLLMLTMITPIEVIYAKETLDAGDVGFGLLLAAWGTGMVGGSWLFARERKRTLPLLIGAATLAMSVGYLGMAVAPGLAIACVASVVGGLGNGVQWVAVVTALQEATEDRFQARVAGLLEAVITIAPGAGFLLGGVLTSLLTPRAAFAVAGGSVLLLVVAGWLILRPRGTEPSAPRREPAPEPAR